MDFDEPQSFISEAIAAVQSATATTAAESEAPSFAAPAGDGGAPDGAQAMALFGHYADGDGGQSVGQAIGQPVGQPVDSAPAQGPELTPEQLQLMKDRADADAALGDKFKIMDAKKLKGKHADNQVSAEEYERIRNTYIDVKRGRTDLDVSDPNNTSAFVPEHDAWVSDLTPDQLREKNAADKAAYDARIAAAQDSVMGDVGTMMQTKAGRELIYKLSNNVDANDPSKHLKTTVHTNDAGNLQGHSLQAVNGFAAEDASANYAAGQPGSDRSLFAALTGALHTTTGTRQSGNLGDNDGRRWDANGRSHGVDDEGRVSAADKGQSRERAAILGLDGYGSQLHGEKITENQYDREQRANGGSAAQYPQFNSVVAESRFNRTGKTR